MGVLDQIKAESDAADSSNVTAGPWGDSPHDYKRSTLSTSFKCIHEFLHNLVEKLNTVNPTIVVDYPIKELGLLNEMKQTDYRLVYESSGQAEVIRFTFTLVSEQEHEFELQESEAIALRLKELQDDGLQVELKDVSGGQQASLVVQGHVPLKFEFQANVEACEIQLTIQNFRKLGTTTHTLKPHQIDDVFLEEFGKYLLRRDNQFYEQDLLEQQSLPLNFYVDTEQELELLLPATKEVDGARIQSLFNRGKSLQLAYHDSIKEMTLQSSDFLIGRSGRCNLVIDSELASREHVRIVYRNGKFILIDGSTNGTFIKMQGGKEVYLRGEEAPLVGSGSISLGESVTVSNEHMIYFNNH